MKKKLKKMLKKNLKKVKKNLKLIIIVIIAIILVTTTGLIIYSKVQKENKESLDNTPNGVELLGTELLGEQRLEEQQKVYDIIDKYIDNQKVKDYVNSNNVTNISLKDIKEKIGIDTTEFENLIYDCSLEYTTIDFTNGIDNYTVSLSCDAFLLSK